MMNFHMQTITNVRDFSMKNNLSIFGGVNNMLAGIWDGFLYDGLLEDAKKIGLPQEDIHRIETTIKLIEEHIESNGESVTLV